MFVKGFQDFHTCIQQLFSILPMFFFLYNFMFLIWINKNIMKKTTKKQNKLKQKTKTNKLFLVYCN